MMMKGKRIESGIWENAAGKGYLVDIQVTDTVTRERPRHRKVCDTLTLARQMRDSLKTDVLRGEIPRKPKIITFEQLADEYLEVWVPTVKEYTAEIESNRIHNVLNPYFGHRRLSAITPHDIDLYLAKRRSGQVGGKKPRPVTSTTVNRDLSRLKHMLGKAVDWDYIQTSPADRIRLGKETPGPHDYLSVEEFQALLEVCPEPLRTMVLVAVHTGIRRGEQLSLTWEDVDFERWLLTLRDTKNHETRHVPLSPVAVECLQAHRKHQALETGQIGRYVFVNPSTGKPYLDLRRGFAKALKRAGISRHLTWHKLRYTTGSQMAMASLGERTVQEMLGHKSVQMTRRYSHLSPEYMHGVAHQLGERLIVPEEIPVSPCDTSCDTQPKTGTDAPEGRP